MGKRLPYKHENLRSDAWRPCRKLAVVAYTCNLSTGKVETGGFLQLLTSQHSQIGELQDFFLISKNKVEFEENT